MKRLQQGFASLRVARRFLNELRADVGKLSALGALSLLMVGFDLLRPWPVKWVVDGALAPTGSVAFTPRTVVLSGALAAALIVAGKAVAQYWREIGLGGTELQLTRRLRHRLFSHLALLSPGFHARHKSGDLLVRLMGDVPMVSTMLVNSLLEVTTRAVFVLGTIVVMMLMDPLLTAATFLVAPLILVLVRSISRSIHIAVSKQRRKEGDLADYLHEAIAATETIQSIGGSAEVLRRFSRSNRRSARAGLKAKKLAARLSASVESLLGAGLAVVFALGGLRVLQGQLTTGELLVFLSYVRTLSKPIRSASKHATKIAKGTACGERLISILDEEPDVQDSPQAVPAPERPRVLAYDAVSFSYDGTGAALRNFTATFRRGELSAIVGRSGAGKSTAAMLALRLMDPTDGRITLDGQTLDELQVDSLRSKVGLCLQRTMLFGESIQENLLLGAPEASDEEIWTALELAGADEFVRGLPEGLESPLGSSGVGLSGGQLSRLSMARTLLRKSAVLIVDEPFAGLDRGAARQLSQTLSKLAEDAIVIVIAHDFENIEEYEHIVFLDAGRKVDEGTHAELAGRLSTYREVVRVHAGGTP